MKVKSQTRIFDIILILCKTTSSKVRSFNQQQKRGVEMPKIQFCVDYEQTFLNLFFELARIESASDEEQLGKRCPTTDGQLRVAQYLLDVMKKIPLSDIRLHENG